MTSTTSPYKAWRNSTLFLCRVWWETIPTAMEYYKTCIRPLLEKMMSDAKQKKPGITSIHNKLDAKDTKNEFKTIYRFEAGSYGDVGRFTPSLACLKLTRKDEWEYHFVLVKPESIHSEEDHATAEARNDMSEAYKVKDIGDSGAELATELRRKGYFSVGDFKIAGSNEFHA